MAKRLLISSGLEGTKEYVKPFLNRLFIYLSKHCSVVDIRDINTFDERSFFEYDQVVFVFFIALDSIPSSTLEIFKKLEGYDKKDTQIYTMALCDEYEPEKCNLAVRTIKQWCIKENMKYMGALKIGAALYLLNDTSRLVVANKIQEFAGAMIQERSIELKVSMLSQKKFLKQANKYWYKGIKKNVKNHKKDIGK